MSKSHIFNMRKIENHTHHFVSFLCEKSFLLFFSHEFGQEISDIFYVKDEPLLGILTFFPKILCDFG